MYSYNQVFEYSKELKVLYVEDDTLVMNETKNMLGDFFAFVETAENGEVALEKYKNFQKKEFEPFDLIITDINMPKKNGLELIKDILDINSEQSIIVFSAYNDSNRLIDLIHLGVDSFIMKPIEQNQLLSVFYKTTKNLSLKKQNKQLLLNQSKLALMGMMVDTIAHQWLQPITTVKMRMEMLRVDSLEQKLNDTKIETFITKNTNQLDHLTSTLNEFRNFLRPNFLLESTTYKEIVNSVVILLEDVLIEHTVELAILIDTDKKIKVVPNEFKHILINIINNAIDAFRKNNIEYRKIDIIAKEVENKQILQIRDNAGGIPKDLISNIFEPYITSKNIEGGTGMGLYLVKQIIDKIGANIDVDNSDDGAVFTITIDS